MPRDGAPDPPHPPSRADRLRAALRANLRKRKGHGSAAPSPPDARAASPAGDPSATGPGAGGSEGGNRGAD